MSFTTHFTLLERLRVPGDERAWTHFVELYAPLLLCWGQRAGMHAEDAADTVQEVLALLFVKLPQFQYDPKRSFRAWLRTVYVNKCRERGRRRAVVAVQDDGTLAEVPDPQTDEDEAQDRQLLVQRNLELIRPEFSPQLWQAFWEYAIRERLPADVAAELGISIGTVYAAKSRVLSRLRCDLDMFFDRA